MSLIVSGGYVSSRIPNPGPITQIQPFTYEDGITFVELLADIRRYIVNDLEPYLVALGIEVDERIITLIESVDAALDAQTAEVDEKLEAQDAANTLAIQNLTTYVNEQVALIIEDSIQVQDPVMAGILGDEDSATRTVTDGLYATPFDIFIRRNETLNLRSVVTPSGTNDAPAINTALNAFAAAGGGKVFIPRDNWTMTDAIRVQNTANPIHLEAEPGTVFDMRGSTQDDGVLLGGAMTATASPLVTDVAKYAVSIACALAVVPGDIIRIQSTELFTPGLAVAVKGELAEVLSNVGGTITVKSPLWDSYSAATTTVTKVLAPRVSVENLSLLRNSTSQGIVIMYARDALMGGLYAAGARERLFMMSNVLGGVIDNVRGTDAYAAGTGTSYGIAVASAQSILEIGNDIRGGRHAVAHGGTFPARDIQVIGGTYDNFHPGAQAAFDFHPNVDTVRMDGVTVLNGIVSGASNLDISNTTVRTGGGTPRTGVELGLWQSSDYVKLKNVDVQMASTVSDAVHVINRAGATATNTRLVELDVTTKPNTGAGIRVSPNSSADTGAVIERLKIRGDIRGGVVIAKSGAAELVVKEVELSGRIESTTAAVTITATAIERVLYDDAEVVTTTASRAAHSGAASSAETIVRNSRLVSRGVAGDRNYFGTGRLELQNSTIEGFTANGGVSAATASEALVSNVQSVNNTGAMGLPARHYSRKNSAGKVTTQGVAAPVAGTWALGDRCENTNPVVGQPVAWVCTVAGTPGTWVSEGNL